jgi:hypothetical protein
LYKKHAIGNCICDRRAGMELMDTDLAWTIHDTPIQVATAAGNSASVLRCRPWSGTGDSKGGDPWSQSTSSRWLSTSSQSNSLSSISLMVTSRT